MKRIMQKRYWNRTSRSSHTGFTLVELLVVLTVIGMLFLTLLPAFSRAKPKSQTARCASNMRMWGWATTMYMADNADHLPFFGDPPNPNRPSWHSALAPYVARASEVGAVFGTPQEGIPSAPLDIYTNEMRKCPAGSYSAPPSLPGAWPSTSWNCWIGANFGAGSSPLTAPFYYSSIPANPPLSISRVGKPADALMFMDTLTHYVYSPVEVSYKFDTDLDGDGRLDSTSQYPIPYNHGRPTVHNGGANVALLDGHVERVSFDKLWRVNTRGNVVHSFWYLED